MAIRRTQTKKGFALIDLLLAIAIVAAVAIIFFVSMDGVRAKARDARRKTDLAQIKTALMGYYNANNKTFPATSKVNTAEEMISAHQVYQKLVPTYLQKMPASPVTSTEYTYNYVTNNPSSDTGGTIFALLANLETPDGSMVYVVNSDGFSGVVTREGPASSYEGYKCGGGSGKNVCVSQVP